MLAMSIRVMFRVRGKVRVRDGVSFRVRVRVGTRSRVRARCRFVFIFFSTSKLESNICPNKKKTSDGIEFPNITNSLLTAMQEMKWIFGTVYAGFIFVNI